MNFGEALEALKSGKKVARAGWNGKGMFLVYVGGTIDAKLTEGTPYEVALATNIVTINDHIDMYTASGQMQPGWLASQQDMLAEDWEVSELVAGSIQEEPKSDAPAAITLTSVDDVAKLIETITGDLLAEIAKIHKDSGVTSDVTNAVADAIATAASTASHANVVQS